MTPDEMKQLASRRRVEDFERGVCGASVRELAVGELRPEQAHETLVAKGFRAHRLPILGPRTRDGEPTWRAPRSGFTRVREEAATELAFVHRDGGVIRIYPTRAPFGAFDEVGELPFARKSLLMPGSATLTLSDEACAITAEGHAVPKVPRPAVGLKYDPGQVHESLDLAERTVRASAISTAPGPEPKLALSPLVGLVSGFTLVAKDYFTVRGRLLDALDGRKNGALRRTRDGSPTYFFPGGRGPGDPFLAPEERFPCAASVSFFEGPGVVGIDAFGFEASVLQLSTFLGTVLDRLECQVFENATGLDVTRLAKRNPYKLLGAEGPILDDET